MTPQMGYLRVFSCLLAVVSTIICEELQGELITVRFEKFEAQWRKFERKFFVHTKDNPKGVEFDLIGKPPDIKNSTETIILTHGYSESKMNIQNIVNAYLKNKKANIISFEWSYAANLNELHAAIATAYLGRFIVGTFIQEFKRRYSIRPEQLHLIGYNMGAHLMGSAGRFLGGNIGRITGLDPYKTYFDDQSIITVRRLSAGDAIFVDVFHTSGKGLAIPVGNIDFYPNGGLFQPRCIDNLSALCNSVMAKEYFTESIRINDSFYGRQAASYDDFKKNDYRKKVISIAGEFGNTTIFGTFYFQTNDKPPYGRKMNGTIYTP